MGFFSLADELPEMLLKSMFMKTHYTQGWYWTAVTTFFFGVSDDFVTSSRFGTTPTPGPFGTTYTLGTPLPRSIGQSGSPYNTLADRPTPFFELLDQGPGGGLRTPISGFTVENQTLTILPTEIRVPPDGDYLIPTDNATDTADLTDAILAAVGEKTTLSFLALVNTPNIGDNSAQIFAFVPLCILDYWFWQPTITVSLQVNLI